MSLDLDLIPNNIKDASSLKNFEGKIRKRKGEKNPSKICKI